MASEPTAQVKLDGELAWAIKSWFEEQANTQDSWFHGMSRTNVEDLTKHLTAAGFRHQGEVASVDYIESIGAVLNPAFRGAYDAIMKGRQQK